MCVHKITTNIHDVLSKQTARFGATNWSQLQLFKYTLGWQQKKYIYISPCKLLRTPGIFLVKNESREPHKPKSRRFQYWRNFEKKFFS